MDSIWLTWSLDQIAFYTTNNSWYNPIKNQTNRKEVIQSKGSGFQTLIQLALASILTQLCSSLLENSSLILHHCISWYGIENGSIIFLTQVLHILAYNLYNYHNKIATKSLSSVQTSNTSWLYQFQAPSSPPRAFVGLLPKKTMTMVTGSNNIKSISVFVNNIYYCFDHQSEK